MNIIEKANKIKRAMDMIAKDEALKDYHKFSERYLWITDKKGDKVKLEQNHVQKVLEKTIKDLRAQGKPPGLVKLRNKYKGEVDDWWYLLLAGSELMSELAEKAGWCLDRIVGGPTRRRKLEAYNVGVLKKKRS